MIYTIFQCPVTIPYCFMPYDETEFSPADYIPVYEGEISGDVNSRTLEALYEALNIHHPNDYHARSLSVSDVIVFDIAGNRKAYYVEPIGFKKNRFSDRYFIPEAPLTILYIKE